MFETLYKIGELIEQYYICLIELEISNQYDTVEYNNYKKLLNDNISKEFKILMRLTPEDFQKLRMDILKRLGNASFSPIALGHLENAYLWRLLFIVISKLGEDALEYEQYLRYDIAKISCKFLESLISDESFENVRSDLIYYKYNLIYMNELLEDDFVKKSGGLSLVSDSYRTKDFLTYRFVDNTVLVLEGKEHLDYLAGLDEGFTLNSNEFSMSIFSIISVLSRLTLCDEFSLPLLENDFNGLLESELTSQEIKREMGDLLNLLERMKDSITR